MNKHLVILRGIPGCGKSTFAERMIDRFINMNRGAIAYKCSADDYFVDDEGNYNFDHSKLSQAHGECKYRADRAMCEGINLVIIDNTNTTKKEMKSYIKMAEKYGYKVKYRVIGGTADEDIAVYAMRNTHGVPTEAIRRMAKRLEDSLNSEE